MPPELTYQFGEDIARRADFFGLNQKYFREYAGKDLRDFSERIAHIGEGMSCTMFYDRPASVLQAMRISTAGALRSIPRTSAQLTAGETYSNFDAFGDTVVLTTFAVDHELRKITPVEGSDARMADVVLDHNLEFYRPLTRYVITFSPAIRHAVNLHYRHGAMPVLRLPKARPGFMMEGELAEDVIIMGYEWPSYDPNILKDFGIDARKAA